MTIPDRLKLPSNWYKATCKIIDYLPDMHGKSMGEVRGFKQSLTCHLDGRSYPKNVTELLSCAYRTPALISIQEIPEGDYKMLRRPRKGGGTLTRYLKNVINLNFGFRRDGYFFFKPLFVKLLEPLLEKGYIRISITKLEDKLSE